MFIPAAEAHDTSYFMSRYIWNVEDDHVVGGSDFEDKTETCSSRSCSNEHDEDVCCFFRYDVYVYTPGASMDQTMSLVSFVPVAVKANQNLMRFLSI